MPIALRKIAPSENLLEKQEQATSTYTRLSGPLRIAVLGVSNAGDLENDQAIAAVAGLILDSGHVMSEHAVVPDESHAICTQIQKWIDGREVDVVLTTDVSCFTSGEAPPDIIIVSDIDGAERSSAVIHHPTLGYIGVVELLTLPKKAA